MLEGTIVLIVSIIINLSVSNYFQSFFKCQKQSCIDSNYTFVNTREMEA